MASLVTHSRQRRLPCKSTLNCIVAPSITFTSSTLLFWMLPSLQWCTESVSPFSSPLLPSLTSSTTQWKDSWPLTSCKCHPLLMTRWPRMPLVSLNGLPSSTSSSATGSWVTSKCSKTFTSTFPPLTPSCLHLTPSRILPLIKLCP